MKKNHLLILCLLILISCSKEEPKIETIKEARQDLELVASLSEAYKALDQGDPYFAAQKFLEAELLFPQSEWAPRSALLASYSYYLQNFYSNSISNLERYLKTYPSDKNHSYAHYLLAMCYYENIVDEKRDSGPIIKARDKFIYVVENFPDTDFAADARFKIDLLQDIIASKEMYLGRYYIKREKWIAAINRFKFVIENFDETIFTEEALHRLVEINYKLGLKNEAQKYANILGYNYLSSEWYEKSYIIFNKEYSQQVKSMPMKDKKGVFNKFRKLFE